jgi:aspartyl-tRNA(Asn)/glutamyl-tRNA(Gln) amidotransferase subunit C
MKLTKEQVEHLAVLARLELKDSEKEKFRDQLSSILEYVEKLKTIDTANVSPTAQASDLLQMARKDQAHERLDAETEKLINAAPDHEGRFVKTKAVFE